jgi:hypothetical protein
MFNFESLGTGGVGGLLTGLAMFLGWSRRLNKLEDNKQDKGVCGTVHENLSKELGGLRGDVQHLTDRIDKLITRNNWDKNK